MMPTRFLAALRGVFSMAAMAALLGGCVIATDSHPRATVAPQARGGAAHCELSADGRQVACGGQASVCQQSSDGRRVACGGLATYCLRSADGATVACGGQATYCDKSSNGSAVACGG